VLAVDMVTIVHVMLPYWEIGQVDDFSAQMILIGKRLLVQFARDHASGRDAIASWVAEVEAASWSSSADVKARYPSISFLGNNRGVFNLKGNHFRLDAQINYSAQVVLVRRIGPHAEYDSWTF
jgi:mRNA interferase HigB